MALRLPKMSYHGRSVEDGICPGHHVQRRRLDERGGGRRRDQQRDPARSAAPEPQR